MGYNMSVLTQFGAGNIKSIQRGVTGTTNAGTPTTASITSVDTAKSILMNLGTTAVTTGTFFGGHGIFELTNATTITFTVDAGVSCRGSWQIVEYF